MYRLDAAQHRVVADAGTVADAHVRPHAARVDQEGAFPRESIAALSSHGLLGLTIPAAYGGLGHGLRTLAATLETVAQRCPSTAMVYLMHSAASTVMRLCPTERNRCCGTRLRGDTS